MPLLAQNAVKHRQHRHGHASSQSALDSRRNWMDLQRQPRALQFRRDLALGRLRGRVVVTAGAGRSTGTDSWASCGRTSRNQPTAPAMARIAPSTLTAPLVTNPANSSVIPNASTIGHAVGAGTSTVSVVVSPFGSMIRQPFASFPQRPMMYTTVKTTTHTTSTKCQYIDKTSTRSACSCFTCPRSVKIDTVARASRPTVT